MKYINSSKPVEWVICNSTGVELNNKEVIIEKYIETMNNMVKIFGKFCDDVGNVGVVDRREK